METEVWIMSNMLISVFVTLGVLTACNSMSNKSQLDAAGSGLVYDTSKIAILPWDSAKWRFEDSGFKPTELTQEDLRIIDSLVHACVINYNQELNLPAEHKAYGIDWDAGNYRQQLVAVINARREKEVWVNCFCHNWGRPWRNNILVVKDGGSCFFHVMINLTTHAFHDLTVNGSA